MFFVLEIIGTIAFAASGAFTGIVSKMDVFGVAILGMTTAVGGGIVRDLILGINPPSAFMHPVYALTAIAVSIIVFLPMIRKLMEKHTMAYDMAMLIMDSIGLGIFTVIGANAAFTAYEEANLFLAVFVGVVTGVGGGVVRDIFAQRIPYIFVKHFYACAAIIGAVCYCLLRNVLSNELSMLAGCVIIIVLRLLAAKFRWKLPRA